MIKSQKPESMKAKFARELLEIVADPYSDPVEHKAAVAEIVNRFAMIYKTLGCLGDMPGINLRDMVDYIGLDASDIMEVPQAEE